MKKFIIALIGLTIGIEVNAQQAPLSNFYNFNEYLLNPAEAGSRNLIDGTASHRVQWQGIEGAPRTTFFGLHGQLNEKMGLGVKIDVDQTDILKQFNAAASYAYRIKLNENASLSFGVSAMMVQNSVDYGRAVVGDLADEVVNGASENGMNFDAEAGIMLSVGKIRLGIASSNLFESSVMYNLPDDRGEGTFDRVRQFRAYGSYEFDLSDKWKLEPFALVRNQGVESFQFELNALTTWNEILYLGAGYRQEAGIIGRVGFQITEKIVAAYAYEFSPTGVAAYSGGSHEFMLGFKLGKRAAAKETIKPPVAEIPKTEPVTIVEKEEVVEETIPAKKEVVITTPPKVEVKEEKVVVPEDVKVAFKKDIKFEFESAAKENSSIPQNKSLDEIADYLIKNSGERVLIKGHTCNMGNDEVNTKYSLKRANTVKNYLLSKGVNENQMKIKAMLDREPLVPNTSIENRKKNRRVEVELIQ